MKLQLFLWNFLRYYQGYVYPEQMSFIKTLTFFSCLILEKGYVVMTFIEGCKWLSNSLLAMNFIKQNYSPLLLSLGLNFICVFFAVWLQGRGALPVGTPLIANHCYNNSVDLKTLTVFIWVCNVSAYVAMPRDTVSRLLWLIQGPW